MFCPTSASWLRTEGVRFCLRLKKNENIEIANENWQSLDELGLTPGVSRFYSNIKVTKTKQIEGFNVAAKWKRKFKGCAQ